jgi:hypothetical protein
MNLAIIVNYNSDYNDISQVVTPNHIKYANRYGYSYHILKNDFTNGRHIVWNKMLIIQKILPIYDWVFFIDTDCLFINFDIDLKTFIDEKYSIVIGQNKSPDYYRHVNEEHLECGAFFVKNEPISFEILNTVYYNVLEGEDVFWREQHNFELLCKKYSWINNRVKRIDANLINAVHWNHVQNPFIYHCANSPEFSNKQKLELLIQKREEFGV